MPSYRETFGLVYIEALSQGIPVIVGKNEGIDGIFADNCTTVNPYSQLSIEDGILKVLRDYESLDFSTIDFSKFDWIEIAKAYYRILKSVKSEN
jgi:glycosyltransferase involved in cell wall biosynthesis